MTAEKDDVVVELLDDLGDSGTLISRIEKFVTEAAKKAAECTHDGVTGTIYIDDEGKFQTTLFISKKFQPRKIMVCCHSED